ncbi:MAG TPA: hypothetical protein VNX86_14105 [Rhizomicrobium sp.]|nr:hypothetical protein [Rhizomicrobium sp.]
MPVHPAQIAAPERDAVPIEEIENLDRYLATVLDAIAKLRSREFAVGSGRSHAGSDRQHLADGVAQEKVIMRHLVHAAQSRNELEQPSDIAFGPVQLPCDISNSRRTKAHRFAKQWTNLGPEHLVRPGHPHRVRGQAYEGAVERDLLVARQALQCRRKGRCGQSRLQRQSQPLAPETLEIRVLRVKR